MKALQIPEDVVDEVVAALNRAIGLAMHKSPDLVDGFSATALRLDEAIQDTKAIEP